jgi:hypothetical protein
MYPIRQRGSMLITNRTFSYEEVPVDFHAFIDCRFDHCTMIYSGRDTLRMDRCMLENVQWFFTDAAARTLRVLAEIYHGFGEAGSAQVEAIFHDIRTGAVDSGTYSTPPSGTLGATPPTGTSGPMPRQHSDPS